MCIRDSCDSVPKGEDAFTKTGYKNWKKAIEKFKSHQSSDAHKSCSLKASEFCNSQKYGSIERKLDSHRSHVVYEIVSILRQLSQIFCFVLVSVLLFKVTGRTKCLKTKETCWSFFY